MRNITLAAFLVTVAIIVPAGWHALDADIQTDGKRLRPLQQSFVVDGTRITLDVDRRIVMTGDTVKATLVAFSETPKQVTVDLRALRSSNYEGARVQMPWTPIDRETLKLTAAPNGGKPVETLIVLGERPDAPALVDAFQIYVCPHGKKLPKTDYDEGGAGEGPVDYDVGISEGWAAGVGITGWSGNNLKMAITAEGKPTADAPFVIAVRVKNTTGQPLARAPRISLSTDAALEGTEEASHEDAAVTIEEISADAVSADAVSADAVSADAVNADDDESNVFKRGQSMVARFRVTPKKPGLGKLTFLASAFESDEEPGPTTAGAMDARTFTLSESIPSVAAR